MIEAGPTLTILGVYKPEIPEAVYQEQWQVTASDELTQAHFNGLVLLEALLDGNAERLFDAIELGQRYQDHFQCAYDEALLSLDGERVLERRMNCITGTGPLRFACYLHFYDPTQPLSWSGGAVECPPIEPAPERLRRLVPYNACT
jgi:hypothetical protein